MYNFQHLLRSTIICKTPAYTLKLIAALVNHFRATLGFTIVSAALPNFSPQPDKHGRHAPDIVARDKNGILQLGEAKANYEDIYSETAKRGIFRFL